MQMQFEQLNQKSYEATLERWTWEADANDGFPHEVERKLNWIKELLSNGHRDQNNKSLAYGVFAEGSEVPAAVCHGLIILDTSIGAHWPP